MKSYPPLQNIKDILDELPLYRALRIQWLWVGYPTITVDHKAEDFRIFDSEELIDAQLAIRLSLAEVFS